MDKKGKRNSKTKPTDNSKEAGGQNRKIYIIRHAERTDEVDHRWVDKSFKNGVYVRYSLNMPLTAPARARDASDTKLDWGADTGLSVLGHWSAQMFGIRLCRLAVKIDQVYSSPAVRCVQTASRIIEAYKAKNESCTLKMFVEEGLFEWGMGIGYLLPNFVAPQALAEGGAPINCDYKTVIDSREINPEETLDDFNKRCIEVITSIVNKLEKGMTALLVTHAPYFDAFNRYLRKPSKKTEDWNKRVQLTPHLFMIGYEEYAPGKWRPIKPPICSFCYGKNDEFKNELLDAHE